MAFAHTNSKGQTYYLHGRMVTLRGGRKQQIYFFAREEKEGVMDAMPEGYIIKENKRTGLPMLAKDRSKDE
jgi:hypothetical protein